MSRNDASLLICTFIPAVIHVFGLFSVYFPAFHPVSFHLKHWPKVISVFRLGSQVKQLIVPIPLHVLGLQNLDVKWRRVFPLALHRHSLCAKVLRQTNVVQHSTSDVYST